MSSSTSLRDRRRRTLRVAMLILCGLLAATGATPCAVAGTGGGAIAGAFVDLEPGGRGAALAGALAPIVDDATALHWNPARLLALGDRAAAISYADLYGLGLVHHTALQVAWPRFGRSLSWEADRIVSRRTDVASAWGFGVQTTRVDLDPESYGEYDLTLAHARRGPWGLNWALAAHVLWVDADLEEVGASGYRLDLAFTRSLPFELTGALVVRSVLSRLSWDNERNETLPPVADVGCAAAPWQTLQVPLVMRFDLETSRLEHISLGAEWQPAGEALTLRGGLRSRDDGDETQLRASLGAGFAWRDVALDYGLAFDREELGETHRFGLHVRF